MSSVTASRKDVRASVRVDTKTIAAVDRIAGQRREWSRSMVIREALVAYINDNELQT